ncbi:hypothetical protein [Paraburkholderia phytofirmans]|uniref:Uncharacterized protein n=1 Tax=Paraburkholderia phytofirmans (strain DSM 17436 / LMG 22146 / PsJN) TaxID=398527 RepID=B2TBA8_PARPJ|nr:hypothetical protein [Paraburkholderia phytofirmans]ACD20850.1 hypothetical protein Bphyt_6548 [Paraburkholderia phytofirmans PsJN]
MSKVRTVLKALSIALAAGALLSSAAAPRAASDGTSLSANGTVAHELFDKGDDYYWVLMRDLGNDGYQCSVSFVTTNGTYSIHGPMDAEMARTGSGMLWFEGPRIPKTAHSTQRVTLAVHGNDGAFNWPALQTTIGNTPYGTLMVAVQIMSVLKEKADTNNLAVSLAGNEVFTAKLVGLQAAYARLAGCMAEHSRS